MCLVVLTDFYILYIQYIHQHADSSTMWLYVDYRDNLSSTETTCALIVPELPFIMHIHILATTDTHSIDTACV